MPSWLSLWKEIADAISSTATGLAIVAAAVWFFRQRLRHPRANIQLDVEHWPVGGRYLLRARVRLANGGTVAIQGRSLLVRVQQVIPLAPDIEEKVAADADPVLAGETEVLWPMVASRECGWNRGERLVEPGETDESHFEFVVPGAIDLVHVYAYFKNTSRWPWQRPLGWHVTIAHSLGAGDSNGKSEADGSAGTSKERTPTPTATPEERVTVTMANEHREDKMVRPADRSVHRPDTIRQATPKPVPPPAPGPKPSGGNGGAGRKEG